MSGVAHLWEKRSNSRTWYSTATKDQRAWIDEIAAHTIEVGTEPPWVAVEEGFKEEWPDESCPVSTTLAKAVRQRVTELSE